MAHLRLVGFVVLAIFVARSVTGQAPDPDRDSIAKRLDRLNHVKVEYALVYHKSALAPEPPLPEPQQRHENKLRQETILESLLPDSFEKKMTFTRFNEFARWDSILSKDAEAWAAKNNIAMSKVFMETFDGTQRQELAQRGPRWIALVIDGDNSPRSWAVELGLGLCLKEGGREGPAWITPALLSKMESRTTPGGNVELTYADTSGQRCQWQFDRKKSYALIEYTRSAGKQPIVRVTPSQFREINGLTLPFKIQMTYYDAKGAVGKGYTATISKYDLGVDKAPVIVFPVGTTVINARDGKGFTVK